MLRLGTGERLSAAGTTLAECWLASASDRNARERDRLGAYLASRLLCGILTLLSAYGAVDFKGC